MSPVTEKQMKASDDIHRREILLFVDDVPISQANVLFDSFKPGYAFEVLAVQHYAEAITAAADYDVDIGAVSCLAAHEVPTAVTREDAVLATAKSARRGTAAEALNLRVTTDGSGLFTGLKVRVTIRKVGLGGFKDDLTVT
jgi:hypothetical protein